MKHWKPICIVLLFLLGIGLTFFAAHLPDALFSVVQNYDYHYVDLRYEEMIVSFRTAGVMLSVWGIALLWKPDRD